MKYDNIPGWPGYYISKRGKVYSRKLPGHTGKSRFGNKWVLHKLSLHKGYYRVRFFDTRKHTKLFSVHRLVALAWVHNPKPKEYNVVMHLDNNPLNNYYKNLKWGTYKQNNLQCHQDNRAYHPSGKNHFNYGKRGEDTPRAKLPDKVWDDICRSILIEHKERKKISERYGISLSSISLHIKRYKLKNEL